ncbi:hypothetical protein BH09BAC5_BH09BAC5_25800 [soil metagenome]
MTQKHSRSNSLVYLLERTHRQAKLLLQHEFEAAGLTISVDQWIVLNRVAEISGQNQKQIADATAKDPASITRIIRLLLQQKLVTKTASKNDQRSILIFISPTGKRMLEISTKRAKNFKSIAGKGMSQEELNALRTLLDKIFENAGGKLF